MTKVRFRSHLRPIIIVMAALAVLAALAASASASRSVSQASTATAPTPLTAAGWRALIGKAQKEGSVNLYSVQAPANLAALAKAFEAKFKIKVNVNRNVDNVMLAQINAEQSTGNYVADIWVPSLKRYVLGASRNGWIADAVGPELLQASGSTARRTWSARAWHVGSAVLGDGVEHEGRPERGHRRQELPGSELPGPHRRSGSARLDELHGLVPLGEQEVRRRDYETKLAAQKPKIYVSSLPMTQAVASGEIIGAPVAAGTALALKEAGAPIDYKVLPDNWNAPYIGVILKPAPHPNAAQLLADYMLSPGGPGTGEQRVRRPLPEHPGHLLREDPRRQRERLHAGEGQGVQRHSGSTSSPSNELAAALPRRLHRPGALPP